MQPRPSSDEALRRLALPPGYRLGEYAIESVLGKGGFGITYLARDIHLGSRVAVKEMLPDGIATRVSNSMVVALTQSQQASFEWALDRFLEEARKVASLNHANIVHVLRLLRENGTAYMVMEYVEGQSLAQWIQHHPRPTEQQMLALLLPLLDGLDHVHRAGLLHRDIKPENIIVAAKDGRPVLLDFGSARENTGRTVSLTCVVSEGYSPFEQYQQKGRQGPYTDLYSLAAMAARAMTGEDLPSAPDRTTDPGIPLAQRLRGRYGETFLRAVDAAFAVRAEDRPQSVAEFRAMLGGAARSPVSLTTRQGMHPLLLTALIVLGAVGAGGGVFLLLGGGSDLAFPGSSVAASTGPAAALIATRSTPFVNSLGMSFVPAGSPGVLFCTTETTVGQFRRFTTEQSYACETDVVSTKAGGEAGKFGHSWKNPGFPQSDEHPVVGVSLNDGHAFCQWLTSFERSAGRIKPGWRYRLPTDCEWSLAAGCTGEAGATPREKSSNSQRLYEWGSSWPPPAGVCNILGVHHGTTKVGYFSRPNPYGLHDMTGNAAELCDEPFCNDPQLSNLRVLRGAGWSAIGSDEQPYRLTEREYVEPDLRNTYHGFRTVLEAR